MYPIPDPVQRVAQSAPFCAELHALGGTGTVDKPIISACTDASESERRSHNPKVAGQARYFDDRYGGLARPFSRQDWTTRRGPT